MIPTADSSGLVRPIGWLAVVCSASAAFGLLMYDYQSGGHGEMGSFYYANSIWFLGFAAWGFGTGVGLLRAWRWARISTLIFSGIVAAVGILGMVAFLSMPAGNVSGGMRLAVRILPTLFLMGPTAIGSGCLVLFSRKEVKAYFGRTRAEAR
jgi:hypothetical protein